MIIYLFEPKSKYFTYCKSHLITALAQTPSVNIWEWVVVTGVDREDLCVSVRVRKNCFSVTKCGTITFNQIRRFQLLVNSPV